MLQPRSATLDLCYTVVFFFVLPLTVRLTFVSHQASLSEYGQRQFVQGSRRVECRLKSTRNSASRPRSSVIVAKVG